MPSKLLLLISEISFELKMHETREFQSKKRQKNKKTVKLFHSSSTVNSSECHSHINTPLMNTYIQPISMFVSNLSCIVEFNEYASVATAANVV